MPGWVQAWPNSAACWSPAMPAIGTARPPPNSVVSPYTSLDEPTTGHHEAGFAFDQRREPAGFQLVTPGGRAAILPHDGVMHRLARLPVPDDGGFALVRYPDRGDVGGRQAGLAERLRRRVQLRGPDLR